MGKSEELAKEEKQELSKRIAEAVSDIATQKEIQGIKSLSRHNPQKVAKILYLYSIGVSQTQMVRKYYLDRDTIINTLLDYADHKNKFRELGGKIAAKNYVNLSSLNEDLVDSLRTRLEAGDLTPEVRDIKDISIAMNNAAHQALTARGEATQIKEDRKIYTKEDYNDTIKAAKERLKNIKKAEVIDVDSPK
tara:strand:+ start:117 stop:692 length:576 start_codon:yes stop_codon:yes gene_type:complete